MIPKDSSGVVDVVEGDKSLWTKKEENSMKVNFTESYHSKRWLQCLFTLHFHLFPWSKAVVKVLFWLWFHFLCHLKITSCSVKYSMQFTLLTQGKQKHLKAKKFYCLLLQQSTNLQHRAPDTGTIFNSSLCLIWQKELVVEQHHVTKTEQLVVGDIKSVIDQQQMM